MLDDTILDGLIVLTSKKPLSFRDIQDRTFKVRARRYGKKYYMSREQELAKIEQFIKDNKVKCERCHTTYTVDWGKFSRKGSCGGYPEDLPAHLRYTVRKGGPKTFKYALEEKLVSSKKGNTS